MNKMNKEFIETISSVAKLFIGSSIAIGVFLIMLYCMKIGFYPSGINVGDGLFFIWTALVFGGLVTISIMALSLAGLAPYNLIAFSLKKILKIPAPTLNMKSLWFLVLISCVTLILFSQDINFTNVKPTKDWLGIILTLLLAGLITTLFINELSSKNNGTERTINLNAMFYLLLLYIAPFLIIDNFGDKVLVKPIDLLSIKEDEVTIHLDKKHSLYLLDILGKKEHKLSIHQVDDGTYRISSVSILFQGIGNVSRLSIQLNDSKLDFNLPTSSFFVSKETKSFQKIGKAIP